MLRNLLIPIVAFLMVSSAYADTKYCMESIVVDPTKTVTNFKFFPEAKTSKFSGMWCTEFEQMREKFFIENGGWLDERALSSVDEYKKEIERISKAIKEEAEKLDAQLNRDETIDVLKKTGNSLLVLFSKYKTIYNCWGPNPGSKVACANDLINWGKNTIVLMQQLSQKPQISEEAEKIKKEFTDLEEKYSAFLSQGNPLILTQEKYNATYGAMCQVVRDNCLFDHSLSPPSNLRFTP